MYKTSSITLTESQSSGMYTDVLPKYIRSERLHIALVTSLQSKAAFQYLNILAAFPFPLCLPSPVASPRVAG